MKVIAITGGPCAGKTSVMGVLRERLARLGVRAAFVPEAATDLIKAGVAPWTCPSMLEFQTRVMALQLERESAALGQAAADGIEVVVCDRGICDSHAYLSDDDYAVALEANGIDHAQALARYDAVFHLVSIAKDNPEAYTKANNSARFEDAEDAVLADGRVMESWLGHPAFRVIGNRPGFDEKAGALFEALVHVLDVGGSANVAKADGSQVT